MGKLENLARQKDRALSRRGFLMTALGGGLAFGFGDPTWAATAFPPLDHRQTGKEPGYEPSSSDVPPGFEPNIWCSIGKDGIVRVNIVRAEMGQHVGSALARLIAEEMDADWEHVEIVHVDTEERFAGQYITGGSWSVWASWTLYRQAGAAARAILVEQASHLLSVPVAHLSVQKSIISGDGKSIGFGDIASRATGPAKHFSPDELKALPLKSTDNFDLIGKDMKALDIPDKVTGQAIYGIDARLPDMVYARPKLPPTRYGKVISIDETECHAVRGYERSIILDDPSGTVPGWVMVIAKTWTAARKAADLLKVVWEKTPAETISENDLQTHAEKLIANPESGIDIFNDKGGDAVFDKAEHILTQTYSTASAAHFTLEPVNATARKNGEIWEIHAGNQCASFALPVIAQALGVEEKQVVIKAYLIGGGFGRKLAGDYLIPAALASKALGGRAVKMVLTRADDMAFDMLRSPSLQKVSAALDPEKAKILAMRYDVAAGWPTAANLPAFMAKGLDGKGKYDPFAISGADHWYEVGPFHLRGICNDLANSTFRPGFLRSVSAGWTTWALESFMDEAAHAVKADPVAFRLNLLSAEGRNAGSAPNSIGGAKRQAYVLHRLAEIIGWPQCNTQLPANTAIGIATTQGQERNMPTWTATAAQIHVNRQNGVVTCQKLWLVLDAGTIVDPDGAIAQTEGAALWGLSLALFEGTEIINGLPKDRNLNSYTPIRMSDMPEIAIEFVQNTNNPTGLGEPGVTAIAPAIGNALFNAVGIRLRHLPLRPGDVLAALAQQTRPASSST